MGSERAEAFQFHPHCIIIHRTIEPSINHVDLAFYQTNVRFKFSILFFQIQHVTFTMGSERSYGFQFRSVSTAPRELRVRNAHESTTQLELSTRNQVVVATCWGAQDGFY